MMSNALMPVNVNQLPVGKYTSEEVFSDLAKAVDWLPRLQLFSIASNEVKQDKFPKNHWGFVVGQNITDLTGEVDVFPVAWRPKAMRIKGKEVVSVFNPKDPEFLKISETVKAKTPNSGCMTGPEYLVWIPAIKRFASYFMNNTSAKMVADDVKRALLEQRPVTLGSRFVQGAQNSWQAPTVNNCSTPFAPEDAPSAEALLAEVNKFANPPEQKREVVEEDGTPQRAR